MDEKERRPVLPPGGSSVIPPKTDPQRKYGGPQSGVPPIYEVASELAPYLIVGIDFGATSLRAATYLDGQPKALRPLEFPSLVESALDVTWDREEPRHSIKPHLGLGTKFRFDDTLYAPEHLAGVLLRRLNNEIETTYERLLAKAVIAVPAGASHAYRKAVQKAAEMAGINLLALLNEPSALALSALCENELNSGHYLVISGGATGFEVAVMHLQKRLLETKVVYSEPSLCGKALTQAYAEAMSKRAQTSTNHALLQTAERVKRELDSKGQSSAILAETTFRIDREAAKEMVGGFEDQIEKLITAALSDAGVYPGQIRGVILGGGTSNLWLLRTWLSNNFDGVKQYQGWVDGGAAIYAALLVRQAKDWVVWDAQCNAIRVRHADQVFNAVAPNSPLPISGHCSLVPDGKETLVATVFEQARNGNCIEAAEVKVEGALQDPQGNERVDLTVHINADGILSFSARQHSLGSQLTIEVREDKYRAQKVIEMGFTPEPPQRSLGSPEQELRTLASPVHPPPLERPVDPDKLAESEQLLERALSALESSHLPPELVERLKSRLQESLRRLSKTAATREALKNRLFYSARLASMVAAGVRLSGVKALLSDFESDCSERPELAPASLSEDPFFAEALRCQTHAEKLAKLEASPEDWVDVPPSAETASVRFYRSARNIFFALLHSAVNRDDKSTAAACMSRLACICAGLGQLTSARDAIELTRVWVKGGAVVPFNTLLDVCQTFFINRNFGAVVQLCLSQIPDLSDVADRDELTCAYINLARAYAALRNYEQAKSMYQNLLSMHTQNPKLQYEYGLLYADFLMRIDDAEAKDYICTLGTLAVAIGALNGSGLRQWQNDWELRRGKPEFA